MGEVIAAGVALMFVFEGVLPFVAPRLWRDLFRRVLDLTDGQVRFFGLVSMVVGLGMLWLVLAFARASGSSP